MRPGTFCEARYTAGTPTRAVAVISHPRELFLKVKRSATDILKRLAILSRVSNEGAFLPRSIRLRKSTDTSSASANCSCVIRRWARISRRCLPNFCLSVATWTVFPSGVSRSIVTSTTERDYGSRFRSEISSIEETLDLFEVA